MKIYCGTIVNTIKTIQKVENWQEYAYCMLGMRPKNDFIKLRNGIIYKLKKEDTSRWMVLEVAVRDAYFPKGFEINENDTVIDIGAHIGSFSILAAKKAKRVISFEPFENTYALLEENMKLNGISNMEAVNIGVSGKKETIKLYFEENDSCRNGAFVEKENSVDIKCTTLREIFGKYRIERCNFLKMDCEGSEYGILLNAPDEILEKIDKIVMEYHDGFIDGLSHEDLRKFLEGRGFAVTVNPPYMYALRTQRF